MRSTEWNSGCKRHCSGAALLEGKAAGLRPESQRRSASCEHAAKSSVGKASRSMRDRFPTSEPIAFLTETATPVPPGVRRVNLAASWIMVILILGGLASLHASSFVPSHLTVLITKAAAILAGLFYGVFFLGVGHFGWDRSNPKIRAAIQQSPKVAKAYIRVPLMAMVFAGSAWLSFSSAFPWALTAAIGGHGSMTVVVAGWQDAFYSPRAGHSCAKPTLRDVPFMMMGRYALCVGDQYKQADFPPGTSLSLIGRVSPFGIIPDRYRFISHSVHSRPKPPVG